MSNTQIEKLKKPGSVKRVIGVVSGKGGVGKSFVTSRLAAIFAQKGYKTAVLDADITGPSIPRCFGLKEMAKGDRDGIEPVRTKLGIQVISVNLLLEEEDAPVVWRGPIIAGTVKQFWSEVLWDDVDYMFVDMPPGTGDVPLTVFQSLPIDGIVIVTSPQELVSMIVKKAVNMARAMEIPVLGLVENYSYIKCPECGKFIQPFGEGKTDDVGAEYGIPVISRLPIDTKIARAMDFGGVEELDLDVLEEAADTLEFLLKDVRHDVDIEEETKKLLIASDDGEDVSKFKESFVLIEARDRIVEKRDTLLIEKDYVSNLKNLGIKAVICAGINKELRTTLKDNGIMVIPVLKQRVDVAVKTYLAGGFSYFEI